jgi:hypothetical protein
MECEGAYNWAVMSARLPHPPFPVPQLPNIYNMDIQESSASSTADQARPDSHAQAPPSGTSAPRGGTGVAQRTMRGELYSHIEMGQQVEDLCNRGLYGVSVTLFCYGALDLAYSSCCPRDDRRRLMLSLLISSNKSSGEYGVTTCFSCNEAYHP